MSMAKRVNLEFVPVGCVVREPLIDWSRLIHEK